METVQADEKSGCLRRTMKILGSIVLTIVVILGVFFVIGKVLTGRIETEDDPRVFSSWGGGTSFLSTRSGTVHILDVGEGEVILLNHGSGRSIADWQEGVAEQLSKSYRVVAFDNYGFGLSDRNGQYRQALWADQAIDVLDALNIDRAVVMGHSAGAMVAAMLAADHPERFCGVVFTGHGFAADPTQMLPLLPGIGEFLLAQDTVIGDTFSDSHREKQEAAYRIKDTRAAYLSFNRSQYGTASLRFVNGTYEDILVPVLQMHGTQDELQSIDSARDLSSRIADTRFVAVEGSGHDVHIDAPEQWVEEVEAFIDSLPPCSP